jgi:PAS domain S-box-containing protein
MRIGHRLVYKLNMVVLVIIVAVILGYGISVVMLSRRFALQGTREVLRFSSASVSEGLIELMQSGRSQEALAFVADFARERGDHGEVSLMRHPDGDIVVGRQPNPHGSSLRQEACRLCHLDEKRPQLSVRPGSVVAERPGLGRYLAVATPIVSRPGCGTTGCHAEVAAGEVMAVLRTDYSLAAFDGLMRSTTGAMGLAAVAALLVSGVVLTLVLRRTLARPLHRVVNGLGALGSGELSYRFDVQRDDEIGLVERSANRLAGRIERQQREIRRALEYLEAIVENTADLVITVNRSGLIQTFNRGAEQALGYERNEVIGRPVEMLFADPRERQLAIARLQERDNVTNWETRFKTRDDCICSVLLTLSRLRDRHGNLIGTMGISKNITTEKELQNKLTRAEQEAAIGRAVTGIQHAVKNMLNTLRGGLYIVRVGDRKGQPEKVAEGCEMIEEGLERISGLSLNMLRYAREWRIEPEPVELRELIRRLLLAVGQTAEERGIRLKTEMDDSLRRVSCDPRLVHMGIMDIVSNALDACETKEYGPGEQPEIVIRLRRDAENRCAVIEIADNGIGMTPEVVANVFTPFFSTKKKWGTGLGLALTDRVIALHDGTIAVESRPHQGSTFRITLPLDGNGTVRKE